MVNKVNKMEGPFVSKTQQSSSNSSSNSSKANDHIVLIINLIENVFKQEVKEISFAINARHCFDYSKLMSDENFLMGLLSVIWMARS